MKTVDGVTKQVFGRGPDGCIDDGNEQKKRGTSIPLRVLAYAFATNWRKASQGLFSIAIGKRLRGRKLIFAAAAIHQNYYQYWIRHVESRFTQRAVAPASCDSLSHVGIFLLADHRNEADHILSSARSIRAAFGEKVTIFTTDDFPYIDVAREVGIGIAPSHCKISREVLSWAVSTFSIDVFIPLYAGDEMAPHAGKLIGQHLGTGSADSILYWDEDRLEDDKRIDAWLKPDWDALHFLAQDYITGACAIGMTIATDASLTGQPAAINHIDALLVSAILERGVTPRHIPHILVHRRRTPDPLVRESRVAAMQHLLPTSVRIFSTDAAILRLEWPLPSPPPSVSIIIPTRDRMDLLQRCMNGVDRLAYPGKVEIIIVDNDSQESATHAYLKTLRKRGNQVITYHGQFNFSAMNNRAAEQASGSFLCLLNNDVEMTNVDWLTHMVAHAVRPGVGAVGARLLYPDGTIQHAGVVVGIGGAAGHMHKGIAGTSPGYHQLPRISRHVTAVTAACMVISKENYWCVGGLDESVFAVAFNDVDLCLKLDRSGFNNVYVAEAELIHHESKSRGSDLDKKNFARFGRELSAMREKWETKNFVDRYHHPRLSRLSENYVLEI